MSYHARPTSSLGNTPGTDARAAYDAPTLGDPIAPRTADLIPEDESLTSTPDRATVRGQSPSLGGRAADSRPWYRRELWLVLELAAIVPTAAAFMVPEPIRMPLVIVSGVLLVVGLAMLLMRRPESAHATVADRYV